VPSLYDVAVFENKSPSFGPLLEDADAPQRLEDLMSIGLGREMVSVSQNLNIENKYFFTCLFLRIY
jgi:UDPglucose--hexose-1-phosphate uridylyltransferase